MPQSGRAPPLRVVHNGLSERRDAGRRRCGATPPRHARHCRAFFGRTRRIGHVHRRHQTGGRCVLGNAIAEICAESDTRAHASHSGSAKGYRAPLRCSRAGTVWSSPPTRCPRGSLPASDSRTCEGAIVARTSARLADHGRPRPEPQRPRCRSRGRPRLRPTTSTRPGALTRGAARRGCRWRPAPCAVSGLAAPGQPRSPGRGPPVHHEKPILRSLRWQAGTLRCMGKQVGVEPRGKTPIRDHFVSQKKKRGSLWPGSFRPRITHSPGRFRSSS